MPEIKLTDEEMKIILLVKKMALTFNGCKDFCGLFCWALNSGLFDIPKGRAGEKILRWDKDGKFRQIDRHQIDWRC